MNENRERTLHYLRMSIWIYFWLLIFEGALRKWVVPQLATPLLLIRDPVVLVSYYLAIKARVFPRNKWVVALGIIAGLSYVITLYPLWNYVAPLKIFLVSIYGFRSNFLHLPLIFLMAAVLRPADLKKFGWWTLVLIVPMALLMIAQFQASPGSFINRTSTGEGEMMTTALGKVRTAGTFSFVVGVVGYFGLATGFLLWAALRRDVYAKWLLMAAGGAITIGIVVSGSRSVVASCALAVASLVPVLFIRPSAVNRFGQTLVVIVVAGYLMTQTPIFREGLNVMNTRFAQVAESSQTSIGGSLVERIADDFKDAFYVYGRAPLLGFGLGVGTNGGAKILTGESTFLLSEVEWSRILLESGPVVGLALLLWRIGLVGWVGWRCLGTVSRSGNVLPLLLFSSSAWPLFSGQLSQPTILGFTVFTTGLALAARNEAIEVVAPDPSEPVAATRPGGRSGRAAPPRMMGRSAYATRLHGPPKEDGSNPNGSLDR